MEASSWQNLLDRLTKTMQHNGELINFKNVHTNAERVMLCSSSALVTNNVGEWMKHSEDSSTNQKDESMALELKLKGNKAYVSKDDDKAFQLYSKSLLNCTANEIALLYGNRSAVLFNKGLLEECIIDIDLALSKGFPVEKSWKLYKRKGDAAWKLNRIPVSISCYEKCIGMLEYDEKLKKEKDKVYALLNAAKDAQHQDKNIFANGVAVDNDPKLYPLHGYNNSVTSASKAVSLVQNENEGRHFIANETIECGSIVISEEPYASVLLPDWFHSHCQHCLSKLTCLYPCEKCSQVCYCSIKCQRESWQSYHYFECGKLNLMKQIGVAHLALRIILLSDMKTLSSFFDNSPARTCKQEIKGCNDGGVYESSYESLYHLMTHSEELQVEDQFQYSVAAFLLLNLISTSQYLSSSTDDYMKFQVGGLLLRHIQQIVCNAHAITSIESTLNISENLVEQDQVRIATALYATSSILNHSCCPNILNTFHKNRLVVKAIKRIPKGNKIYTCYGPHYRRMNFTERHNALRGQYFFSCVCEYCAKGLRVMEDFDCFHCPKCRKIFRSGDRICASCGTAVDLLTSEYGKKSAHAVELFASGLELLNDGQSEKAQCSRSYKNKTISLALTSFLNCSKIREMIYFKFHTLLGETYDAIAKCYAILYKYSDSIAYIKRSLLVVESHYGGESAEITNEYLKLCDVYLALMQSFIDKKDRNGIQKYHAEALNTVEKSIRLVELNKEPESPDLLDLRCKHDSLIKLAYMDSVSA